MKKSNVIGLTIGIVVVIVVVSLVSWFAIKPVPNLIQGEVEVKSVKISSKLAGRIEQMNVHEGQQVKKGELLFELSTPEVEAGRIGPECGAGSEPESTQGRTFTGDRCGLQLVAKGPNGSGVGPEEL